MTAYYVVMSCIYMISVLAAAVTWHRFGLRDGRKQGYEAGCEVRQGDSTKHFQAGFAAGRDQARREDREDYHAALARSSELTYRDGYRDGFKEIIRAVTEAIGEVDKDKVKTCDGDGDGDVTGPAVSGKTDQLVNEDKPCMP